MKRMWIRLLLFALAAFVTLVGVSWISDHLTGDSTLQSSKARSDLIVAPTSLGWATVPRAIVCRGNQLIPAGCA